MMSGQPGTAIRTFTLIIQSDPGFVEARFNRGVAHLRAGDNIRAAADFEKVFEVSPPLRAPAAFHRALAADAAAQPDVAAAWLDKCIAADPGFSDAILYLGVIRERQSDFQGAGKMYRQYLDRNPDSLVAALRFGVTAQASGHPETAIRYLRKVVEAAPGSAEGIEAAKFLVMWE